MRKVTLYILSIVLILFFIGYNSFYRKIQYKEVSFNLATDGIAVLTGGKGRIKLGLELMSVHQNIKLLISGVDKKVSINSIIPTYLESKNDILLDKDSESTYQNALVISEWVKKNNLKNVTIITSYYHMPRSMLLLKTLIPKEKLYPYPVKRKHSRKGTFKDNVFYYFFLTEEYIKYLLSYIIILKK